MHRFKLMGLALLAVLAVASVASATASAEAPLLLVLSGEKVSELTFKGETAEKATATLETVGGKTITCSEKETKRAATATATFEEASGKPADSEKGKATIDFVGCKQGAVACRSEELNEKKETVSKDPVETILTPLSLLGGSETTSTSELQYILANKISPTLGILFLNCGGVKEEIKGDVPCLVKPALTEVAAGGVVKIECVQSKGDQVTGTCVENATTCKELKENPLLANLGTGKFELSGEQVTISGTFNKMVLLDD